MKATDLHDDGISLEDDEMRILETWGELRSLILPCRVAVLALLWVGLLKCLFSQPLTYSGKKQALSGGVFFSVSFLGSASNFSQVVSWFLLPQSTSLPIDRRPITSVLSAMIQSNEGEIRKACLEWGPVTWGTCQMGM